MSLLKNNYFILLSALLGIIGIFLLVTPQFNKAKINCKIDFSKKTIDIGKVKKTDSSKAIFYFTNKTSRSIRIKNVKTDCHCTVANWPRSKIYPNKSSKIVVQYDNHSLGFFEQLVEVKFKGCENPILLIFRGIVVKNKISGV